LNETPERAALSPGFLPGSWVFRGPRGLRAGWAVLLFACLVYGLMMVCGAVVAPWLHIERNAPIAPFTGLLLELSQFVPVLAATTIMSVLERRPLLSYGYQGRACAVRLFSGAVWGFIGISAVIVCLRSLGYLAIEGRILGGAAAVRYGLEWGGVFLLVGLTEESMFRGYAQFTMARGIGFWWGAVLLAVPFGLMHATNDGESLAGLLGAGVVGLMFCISLWYTGSLWWAVGFHAAWDWGQSYFYGTADSGMMARGHLLREHPVGSVLWSGGVTGPEGSVLVLPLLVMMAAAMTWWWGRRGERPFRGGGWRPMRMSKPEA
jgi:uncharacterized protein